MIFNGCYTFFEIIFKPNGLNKIFRIRSYEITDRITWGDEILDSGIKLLHEQLFHSNGVTEMAALADAYLLHYLKKQKTVDSKDRITSTVDFIIKNAGLINIDQLAYNANMSIRNFERHFNASVGISPKLLCCITRFNHALELKLKNPGIEWTSIAHQLGYFDQMHLIKDFKKFTGGTPSSLLKHIPLFEQNYTSRVHA